MALRIAWADGSGPVRRLIEHGMDRSGAGHTIALFEDHAGLLRAHERAPFDVVVLHTTVPSDPLNANAVVRRLRLASPSTVVALCSGCSLDGDERCPGGIRVAHAADPDRFDRWIPKPFSFRDIVGWLDSLDRRS